MRALLLQIAHPKIAQGVADHSRYREDPVWSKNSSALRYQHFIAPGKAW